MKKGQVEFITIKTGQKFRWDGKLFIKDSDVGTAVRLSNGEIVDFCDAGIQFVRPVKISIKIVEEKN